MNPHKRTSRIPFFECIALSKPRGRPAVMRFACNIVVYPWIWGRQPTANVLLQLVTYEAVSTYIPENVNIMRLRTFQLVNLIRQFLHQHWWTH